MSGAVALPARSVPIATLRSWTPWTATQNAHLLGVFSGGGCVRDIPIFRRNDGSLSAGVPNIPKLDREGRVRLKADGKRDYVSVISFTTNIARARWNELVLAALRDGGINPNQDRTP